MHVMDMQLHKNQDKGLQSTSFASNHHSPIIPNYQGVLKGGFFPARVNNPLNIARVSH